ncbi:glutamine amidotransferase-like protein [Diplodia corticola]|uniref:Glutamine amidotransferase-like protein n=1 Tax=Diplodia corticola TaxID=236234 RepID=A0A1J9RA80_9PEZI|nr:glutamine amidotransferase-like protein [Diplodia corticola]OJD37448.1 glutamine amidotransferase-like protein [Diplodia corticola]
MAVPQTFNIALLDADTPVPAVLSARGRYSDIFQGLLESALIRLAKANLVTSNPLPKVQFTAYDIVRGDYPPDPSSLHGIVISGAAGSAYDSDPWILTLSAWLRHIHASHPHIKIFGSCFGHQILCSTLLSPLDPAATVAKNPAGMELGIHAVTLSPAFLRAFPVDVLALPSSPLPPSSRQYDDDDDDDESDEGESSGEGEVRMKLQFVHSDHVVLPPSPSPLLMSIGATPRCAVQGVYDGDRVLSLQGHFEFDAFVNAATIDVFGRVWAASMVVREGEENWFEEAMARVKDAGGDDAGWAAEVVMAFLMGLGGGEEGEKRVVVGAGGAVVEGGLLTPPEEEEMAVAM